MDKHNLVGNLGSRGSQWNSKERWNQHVSIELERKVRVHRRRQENPKELSRLDDLYTCSEKGKAGNWSWGPWRYSKVDGRPALSYKSTCNREWTKLTLPISSFSSFLLLPWSMTEEKGEDTMKESKASQQHQDLTMESAHKEHVLCFHLLM